MDGSTPPVTPSVSLPDGATATEEEMRQYGVALQRFVQDTEARLPGIADNRQHDRIVDYLHLLADSYNVQLRAHHAAERRRQDARLLVLLSCVAIFAAED